MFFSAALPLMACLSIYARRCIQRKPSQNNIFDLFYGTKTKQSDVSDSDKIIFREITEKDCSDPKVGIGEAKEACLRNNQEYYRRKDMDDDIYA